MQKITIKAFADGARLDSFIADNTDLSRSAAAKLCEDGAVTINSKLVGKKVRVLPDDVIVIELPDPVPSEALPEDIPLDIVFEDEDLLVVNKPKDMVVHPAVGNLSGTLVNALIAHCGDSLSGINGVMRPGILHRIDKNTSGLLMVAKNDNAHRFLAEQIKEHSFTREYEAIVHGNIKNDEGRIDAPIGRHPIKRKQMAVTDRNSKPAVTHYKVINRYDGFTHVRLKLETGRTHQIRVHMAYLGHPVAGDDVYGPKKAAVGLHGQCLHAKKLGFIHPKTHEYTEFETELPQYFKDFIKRIGSTNG